MNIIMSRALQQQYHHRSHQPCLTPTSPLDFTDRIPFRELTLSKETLGSGSFGTVYKGFWRGRNVAVKQFKTREEIDSFSVEVKQLSCVKHENIVTLYGASTLSDTAFLIMEYAEGGSLNHLLHEFKQQRYDLRHACSWAMQTARGVAYLHGMSPKPIMHRDLKPANLLLFSRGKIIKICDFGTACTVKTQMTNNTGSASYMAPEVFATNSYLESGDVFSWSIIFWEILARQHPYATEQYSNPYQILWSITQNGTRPTELEDCPEIIWRLITRSWNKDPKRRPTMLEVAEEMQFIFSLTESKSSTSKNHNVIQNTANTTTMSKNDNFVSPNQLQKRQQQQQHQMFAPCISSVLLDQQHPQKHNQQSQFKCGLNKQNPPSLKSPSSCGTGATTTSVKKELYIHSKALHHRLELLCKRKEELEKSTRCDRRNTTCELLNEFKELKKQTELKKEELKQRQLTSTSTTFNSFQHPSTTNQKCIE